MKNVMMAILAIIIRVVLLENTVNAASLTTTGAYTIADFEATKVSDLSGRPNTMPATIAVSTDEFTISVGSIGNRTGYTKWFLTDAQFQTSNNVVILALTRLKTITAGLGKYVYGIKPYIPFYEAQFTTSLGAIVFSHSLSNNDVKWLDFSPDWSADALYLNLDDTMLSSSHTGEVAFNAIDKNGVAIPVVVNNSNNALIVTFYDPTSGVQLTEAQVIALEIAGNFSIQGPLFFKSDALLLNDCTMIISGALAE